MDAWIGFALQERERELFIAFIAETKEKAEKETKEQFPKDPIICLKLADELGSQLSYWLAEHDILGAENVRIIKEVGAELLKMVDEDG